MLWLFRRPAVVSADRSIGEPARGHRRHVSRAMGEIQAALGHPKVKIRRKLPSGNDTGLHNARTDTFHGISGRRVGDKSPTGKGGDKSPQSTSKGSGTVAKMPRTRRALEGARDFGGGLVLGAECFTK